MAVPYNEIPAKYADVMMLLSYVSIIQQALLEKKRHDLFREYLPAD